jgi:uncharacterized OB-fold protein
MTNGPGPVRPRPVPDERTAPYWEAAARGELAIQRCSSCGTFYHPPVPVCEDCYGLDLRFEAVSGRGTIHSRVILDSPVVPGFEHVLPYACLAVELDEQAGLLVVANLLEAPADSAQVGRRVNVAFERLDSETMLPQFVLADERSNQ